MAQDVLERRDGGNATADLGWKEQTIEVWVFLFLIVPSIALSLFVVRQGQLGFVLTASSIILRDLALVCLILFFLWRNGESRSLIGWTVARPSREMILGALLFIPFFLTVLGVEWTFRQFGVTAPTTKMPSFLTVNDIPQLVLAFALVAVVAVAEETIFRGYLLLRFRATTRSTVLAVIYSSGIFGLGHGYEGTLGLVTVTLMGAMLSIVYLWRKSLVAPMVIHFLQDFMAIVLVPLLKLG